VDDDRLANVLGRRCALVDRNVHVGDDDGVWKNVGDVENVANPDNAVIVGDALSLNVSDDHV